MELSQLYYFKTIAESASMTRAAEKLHVSQPALSAALKKLEDELGVRLFERQKNKIVLNDAGRLAFTYACAVLGQTEEMKNAFKQYALRNGTISIGFCDPGPMRLSVPLFQKSYPDLEVSAEISEDEYNGLNYLLSHRYVLFISLDKLEHPDVISFPFAKEELMLSVPQGHPLAERQSVCLLEERPENIAAYRIYGAFERRIQPFLDRMIPELSVKVYEDFFVYAQMLGQKETLGFTTRLVQQYRHDGNGRLCIPMKDAGISVTYWGSYLKKNKALVRPFLDWHQENKLMLLGAESNK